MKQESAVQENGFLPNELKEAGISYSLAALFPMLVVFLLMLIFQAAFGAGYADTDWFKYLSFLVPQVCFAAVCLIFFRRSKTSPRTCYTGCKWHYFLIALVLQFGLLFSLSELNVYFIKFLGLFGYKGGNTEEAIPTLSGWNLLPAILVIALLPAIFEETLFRGILSGSMQRRGWGTASTVLISGALFSLFHHNPEQTLYQFACGMCFTLVALRAGSILPTMIAHFANNALILCLTAGGIESMRTALPLGGYVVLVVVAGLCLAGALFYLLYFERGKNQRGGVKGGGKFFLFAAVGIAVCAVQWVAMLVEGFK